MEWQQQNYLFPFEMHVIKYFLFQVCLYHSEMLDYLRCDALLIGSGPVQL